MCLNANSQIIILDVENCILKDSIIVVEYMMICFFKINIIAEKCLDIDEYFEVESKSIKIN